MKILSILALMLTTVTAQAQYSDDYFRIDSVTVEDVSDQYPEIQLSDLPTNYKDCSPNPDLKAATTDDVSLEDVIKDTNNLSVLIDAIVNAGKKIWALVSAGKPSYNLKLDIAHAMPYGISCWADLEGWQAPKSTTYQISYKNLYGMEVVRFAYRVVFTYGGKFKEQGNYITYATVQPAALDVRWGFTFNAEANVPSVFNMGTKKAPVAAMQLNMKWSVDTVVGHNEMTQAYFLSGKGEMKQLP